MEPDALDWYYLDRSGQEFGPFSSKKMRAWYTAGFFPIGDKLLCRTQHWTRHTPVAELWPSGREPFVGAPKEPGAAGAGPCGPPPRGPPPEFAGPPPSMAPHMPPAGYGPPPPSWGPPPGHYSMPPPGYAPAPGPMWGPPPMGAYAPPPGGHYGPPPMVPYGYGHPGPPPGHYGMPMLPMPPPPPGPGGYYPPPQGYGPRADSRSRSPRGRGPQKRGTPRGNRGNAGKSGDGRGFKPHHTSSVPKATDLAVKFTASDGPPTTGMLRNIPNKYMQDGLLEEIDSAGFDGTYDFFYLPMDVRNNANVGYAFINFFEPPDFERFRQTFEGYQFKRAGSKKIATVSPAVVQGLKANVQNLMKKRVAQGQYRPLVLRGGRRVDIEVAAEELVAETGSRPSTFALDGPATTNGGPAPAEQGAAAEAPAESEARA